MTTRERAEATLGGAVAGFCGGLFGVGGGIIMVPILTGRLGLTQHQAPGTSLAVIIFTAIASGAVYAAHGNVSWVLGIVVGLASIATAPLGARLASKLSSASLRRAFAVCMLLVAVRLTWSPAHTPPHMMHGIAALGVDVAIGVAVGVLAGFMGVGGGLLAVPAFTLLLGMPQQLAQGTSLLVILGAASSGARAHAMRGNVIMPLVPWLGLGAVLAGPLASWWVQRLPQLLLARGFAAFLVVSAVYTWIQAPKTAR